MRRIQPAIDAMRRGVERYDGIVNKVQGDGVMALFGAPVPREDHAVRACARSPGDPGCGSRTRRSRSENPGRHPQRRGDPAGGRQQPLSHLRCVRFGGPSGGADGADGGAGRNPADRRHGCCGAQLRRNHVAWIPPGSRGVRTGRGFQAGAPASCAGQRDFPQPDVHSVR